MTNTTLIGKAPQVTKTARGLSQRAVFDADAARFDKAFRSAGAIVTEADGFEWVDEAKVPSQLISAYRSFVQYGFANGLM